MEEDDCAPLALIWVKPFLKFNDHPLYENVGSNHHPSILTNIPESATTNQNAYPWFNPPPCSQKVKTRVGDQFFKMIQEHFPESNPLSKILNGNTVKMTYGCILICQGLFQPTTQKCLNQKTKEMAC